MFQVFGHEACGILASQPGIKPALPALEGDVLTTGLPGGGRKKKSMQQRSMLFAKSKVDPLQKIFTGFCLQSILHIHPSSGLVAGRGTPSMAQK